MKFYNLSIFFLFVLYGCSDSKKSDTVSTIMLNDCEFTVSFLNKLKTDTAIIPLSSLVEGCELVQLEYTEEALIKPDFTTVTNNYIGVKQEMSSYKLFSRSGKFLCSIGSFGQGPGEYDLINDDIIDDEKGLIYLAPLIGGNKILVYNTVGTFLRNIEMPQNIIAPVIFISDDILTVVYVTDTDDKSMATQINIHTGQVLNEFTTQVPQYEDYSFCNTRNMQGIFDLVHMSFDTVYHLNMSSNSLRPIFAMTDNSSEKLYKLHCQLNKDLVLTTIANVRGLIATDLKNKKSSWVKVENDYFGNLEMPNYVYNFLNGYYAHNIQPEQLIENIEQRLTENNVTEKDRTVLHKMLLSIKKDGNNLVFIGKLKKEVETPLY